MYYWFKFASKIDVQIGSMSPHLPARLLCWAAACKKFVMLTHWGPVTHICVSNLTIIGSDNGLSPSRRQAIIWTNAGILFSEILFEVLTFSFKNMHLKMSGNGRPFCLGPNVLNKWFRAQIHRLIYKSLNGILKSNIWNVCRISEEPMI